MKITLKQMTLENFKGIKSLALNFGEQTTISGANGTGKTTIYDAFLWCLFGKDSADRKDFSVKTIEPTGKAIEKIEHSVELVLNQDGIETTFRRVLTELWQTRRGDTEAQFKGNETKFFVNSVPHQAREYQKVINDLCDETRFKLITSPTYFNEVMKWEQRRAMLTEIAGGISDQELAESRPDFSALFAQLSGKDLEGYRKEIAYKKKAVKEELEAIPTRIDEATRAMPENRDWDEIRRSIAFAERDIQDIEEELANSAKTTERHNKEQAGIRSEIEAKRRQLQQIEFDLQSDDEKALREYAEKKRNLEGNVRSAESDLIRLSNEADGITQTRKRYEARMAELRKEWNEINSESFDFDKLGDGVCPACKRPLDPSDIEERRALFTESFNKKKLEELTKINEAGVKAKAEVEKCNELIISLQSQMEEAQARMDGFRKSLEALKEPQTKDLAQLITSSPKHKQLSGEIAALRERIVEVAPVNNEELKAKKSELNQKLDTLKLQLANKDLIAAGKARIEELNKQTKQLAQQLADLEKTEFTIAEFTRVKVSAIEQRVNELFQTVRFKMFRDLINGGEELCCEATVNGVPYPDVNNAGKINAGLDVIRTISKHIGITAPVFIDNAEAVNELLPIEAQIIRLVVTKDNQLTINLK